MQHHFNNAQDQFGNGVVRASVLVQQNGVTSTIYSDNGSTIKANPMTTGAAGAFDFYAANGNYTLSITAPNGSVTTSAVTLFDPDSLSASSGAGMVGYDGDTAQTVLDDAKPMQSYTALRAYTGRATGVRITSTGLAGFFSRSLTDTTSADNGGTIIVDGSGRRWLRLFTGAPSVKWFGAKGDGVTDDTAAIQAAIDYAVYTASTKIAVVYFPPGTYKTSDTLHAGYGAAGFTSITLEGAGSSYDGEEAFGGSRIVPTFSDRPGVNFQGTRRGHLKGLALTGMNAAYIKANLLGSLTCTVDDTDVATWIDPALNANAASRYAPYAGVTIDAYSGAQPGTHYPAVTYPAFLGAPAQYGKSFSSNVVIEDCYISGFVAAVAIQPGDSDGNGDFVSLRDTTINYCAYGVSVGNGQSRQVNFYNCQIAAVHTALTNNKHGRQIGKFGGVVSGTAIEGVIQLFDLSTGYCGPMLFEGCYGELVWRLGNSNAPASGSYPLTMVCSEFAMINHPAIRGVPRMIVEGGGAPITLRGGTLVVPSIASAAGAFIIDGAAVMPSDIDGSTTARQLAQGVSGGLLPLGSLIVADDSREIRTRNPNALALTKNAKPAGRAAPLPRIAQTVQWREVAFSYPPAPCARFISVASVASSALTISGLSGSIDFTASNPSPYGVHAGDLVQHDLTGTIFLVTSNAGAVASVTALNNYYNPGSGQVLRSAIAAGNWYVVTSRAYGTTYPLFGDVTSGSNQITNLSRGDGYGGFVTTDIAVGDYIAQLPWTTNIFANGVTVSAWDSGTRALTMSGNASKTASQQPFHFWVRA